MCHNHNFDIENFEKNFDEKLLKLERAYETPTYENALELKGVFKELLNMEKIDHTKLHNLLRSNGFTKNYKNSFLIQSVYLLYDKNELTKEQQLHLQNILRIKRCKSHSGINSITIFTSAYPEYIDEDGTLKKQMFSCKYDCHFCPKPPDMPRSYLRQEPGVMRAVQYEFDPCRQMWGRMKSLYQIGHQIDKLEVLVLGATWSSYPILYREQFIRDTYYAANTFWDQDKRKKGTLKEEIDINRDTKCRVIGLTLETRPDCVNKREIQRFRSYGCTRIQLGVQHIDNDILKANNRQCTTERFIKGMKMLKDSGYKVDIHIMPNLYTTTPEKDRDMILNKLLGRKSDTRIEQIGDISWEYHDIAEPSLSADQWKLYPTAITVYTELERLYREGIYVPYPEEELTKLLYDTKLNMYSWIRTNRIIRDIPQTVIIASSNKSNAGQVILDMLKKNGDVCMCIRCRETKEKYWDGTYQIVVREYKASEGKEYFISAESQDKLTLYGFTRLRLCQPAVDIFPELEGCALIRELHVYSNMNPVGENNNTVQHKGIGKRLISIAEKIAQDNGFRNMAIIAGVGVKRYYEKIGYFNDSEGKGDFMIKHF
jgi:ELP3 family radical SAM enzyme/protein acetyltransferase